MNIRYYLLFLLIVITLGFGGVFSCSDDFEEEYEPDNNNESFTVSSINQTPQQTCKSCRHQSFGIEDFKTVIDPNITKTFPLTIKLLDSKDKPLDHLELPNIENDCKNIMPTIEEFKDKYPNAIDLDIDFIEGNFRLVGDEDEILDNNKLNKIKNERFPPPPPQPKPQPVPQPQPAPQPQPVPQPQPKAPSKPKLPSPPIAIPVPPIPVPQPVPVPVPLPLPVPKKIPLPFKFIVLNSIIMNSNSLVIAGANSDDKTVINVYGKCSYKLKVKEVIYKETKDCNICGLENPTPSKSCVHPNTN